MSYCPLTNASSWDAGWIWPRLKSKQPELQDLYEHNARMLIGTWTETLSPVRDYAHKEWGGLLKDYYLPRWTNYIAYLKGTLEGRSLTVPDSVSSGEGVGKCT